MTLEELYRIIADASRFYLNGEMSGPAYARMVEALIAASGLEDVESALEELADSMARYAPHGGDGLSDDDALRVIAQRFANG
jgi:hypothetical protein